MTKTSYPRRNNYSVSGIIVKNDASINAAGTVAHFRIAACSGSRDQASPFFDCVHFKPQDGEIDPSVLRKGSKVMMEGYFHMNNYNGKDRLELVVVSVKPNLPVEVEVEDYDIDDLPE